MHDPLVLAYAIRRPALNKLRPSTFRREWRCWKRWTFWGRLWRSTSTHFIDVWHREPQGHDALTVCSRSSRWRWHIHHWHLRFWPAFNARKWALLRCAECGRRGRWGYAWTSNSWHQGNKLRHWKVLHEECSSLQWLRRQADQDVELIRLLTSIGRIASDESEREYIGHIEATGAPFYVVNRMKSALGWERNEEGELVRTS